MDDSLARLQADDELSSAVAVSDHPACKRYIWRLCHEMLPRLRLTRKYAWPGSQDELDAMIADAVKAARPALGWRSPEGEDDERDR